MPIQTSPGLTPPLVQPITLTRGPHSHLATLMDAAILIRDLDQFRQVLPTRNLKYAVSGRAQLSGDPG
jgi:hypothetical protein